MSDDARARLEGMAALGEGTTPGRWYWSAYDNGVLVDVPGGSAQIAAMVSSNPVEDAALIAAAPNLPALAAYALRAMPWLATAARGQFCLCCGEPEPHRYGHADDCELAALLRGPDLP